MLVIPGSSPRSLEPRLGSFVSALLLARPSVMTDWRSTCSPRRHSMGARDPGDSERRQQDCCAQTTLLSPGLPRCRPLEFQARAESSRSTNPSAPTGERSTSMTRCSWGGTKLDSGAGIPLDKLHELGPSDNNTYVTCTSDNGIESEPCGLPFGERTFHKARPLLSHEYELNEGGTPVRFIVRRPDVRVGRHSGYRRGERSRRPAHSKGQLMHATMMTYWKNVEAHGSRN